MSKGANNLTLNDDHDSADMQCIACGQVVHVTADRMFKPAYSEITKSLQDKSLSVLDAVALTDSIGEETFYIRTIQNKER